MKVLICEPYEERLEQMFKFLQEKDYQVSSVNNGRDAQKILAQGEHEITLLNIELSSFSAIEVIKFIQSRGIKTKVILVAENNLALEERIHSKSLLKKIGVAEALIHPFPLTSLEKAIKGFSHYQNWRNIVKSQTVEDNEPCEAFDDQFTSIEMESFFCGNMAIFDLFIRLGKNKYLKILNQGEVMEQERLDRYSKDENVNFLYFRTEDRKIYINFLNDLVKNIQKKGNVSPLIKTKFVKSLANKLLEEVYTKGLGKETLLETANLCENIHNNLLSMSALSSMFAELKLHEDDVETHLFLTALYSDIIAKNLGWVTDHSRPKILMGALLHDIGKLKLPRNLRLKKGFELSGAQLTEYQKHPEYGVHLLDQVPQIGEQVKQIVFQHHELVNGEGFPYGISGVKIYPPAKIVAFANKMAEISIMTKRSPYASIKLLIEEKKEIFNYDPEVVKAFIRSFIKGQAHED